MKKPTILHNTPGDAMATDSVRIETISNWDKLSLSDGVTTVLGNECFYIYFVFIFIFSITYCFQSSSTK